jgi:hypothetical protein
VRVNHAGIVETMKLALQHNQAGQRIPGFKIPAGIYALKVRRGDLAANPIIKILSEVTDVDFRRDYDFFMANSEIGVTGRLDVEGIRTTVSNQTTAGFDLRVVFTVPDLALRVSEVSVCETRRGNRCGAGLQASFRNSAVILQRGSRITVTADFKVNINEDMARLRLVNATSNLGHRTGPSVNLQLGPLTVPPVSILVDGQEIPVDTSHLRGEILNHRTFLAHKLMNFAGEFIAQDLAAVVNKALKNQCLPTSLTVVDLEPRPVPQLPVVADIERHPDFMRQFQRDTARLVKSVRFDLSLKNLRTPESKHLEIRADGSLRLNGLRWTVGNTLGNTARTLPALDLDRAVPVTDEVAVAVSEPVINAGLAALAHQGLFQKLIESHVDVGGLYLTNAKAHFKTTTDGKSVLNVVANLRLNLREVKATSVLGWIQKQIAIWLERNNNNANLIFPLQFEVHPRLVETAGVRKLLLRVNSPFTSPGTFRNEYGYANNVVEATRPVRDEVSKELQRNLGAYVEREFEFPLDAYLTQKGVTIHPRHVQVLDSAYLLVTGDIGNITFSQLPGSGAPRCQ